MGRMDRAPMKCPGIKCQHSRECMIKVLMVVTISMVTPISVLEALTDNRVTISVLEALTEHRVAVLEQKLGASEGRAVSTAMGVVLAILVVMHMGLTLHGPIVGIDSAAEAILHVGRTNPSNLMRTEDEWTRTR